MQPGATHPSDSTTAVARKQIWAALLLAWVAAFSDAIGFLVLQQLGASFMSGNSMAMGVALGRLDWPSVLQRGLPILAFFLGNLLGFLVLMQVRRWGIRSPFAVVFGLEALCLLAFLLLGTHALEGGIIRTSPSGIFAACVVLLTLAMGLQTATVRRAAGQGVRTTFVTGVLSDWAHLLTEYLSWLRQQPRKQHVRRPCGNRCSKPPFGISSCWPASGDVMCWGPSAEALSSCTWHSSPWSSPCAFSRC
jgi:uncharacterized membrane protein YoaK (UPF0700 family)